MQNFDIALILQIFVLLNPFASFPFLMNAYKKKFNVKIIATKAVSVAFVIAIATVFLGPILFSVFGVTLNSFRIAGGVVLLLLGINMVRPSDGHQNSIHIQSLITIIATPLLTGPATISFLTIKVYEIGKTTLLINLISAFVLVAIVFFLFSHLVDKINARIVDIISRVLGLFLTAVAIELISEGIQGIGIFL